METENTKSLPVLNDFLFFKKLLEKKCNSLLIGQYLQKYNFVPVTHKGCLVGA